MLGLSHITLLLMLIVILWWHRC